MDDYLRSQQFLNIKPKQHSKEPFKSINYTNDYPSKQLPTTDVIDKETCTQTTQMVNTNTITAIKEEETVYCNNTHLNKKHQRSQEPNKTALYYRMNQKQKLNALLTEKTTLLNQIKSMEHKPISLIQMIIDLIPSSLNEFREIIVPTYISLIDLEECQSYTEYINSQIETLEDIYSFKETHLNYQDNAELFKEQYALYSFFRKVLIFIDKLRKYYAFISKYK